MGTLIEIEWRSGKITRFPDTGSGSDGFGESVLAEADIRFDDVSGGLFMEVRHHEPLRPSEDDLASASAELDPRGIPCQIYNDYYVELVSADDMGEVVWLSYDGKPRFVRIDGELVNLAKVTALQKLYLGDAKASGAILSQIAALLEVIEPQVRARLSSGTDPRGPANVEDACAEELGVSRATLDAARCFQALEGSRDEDGSTGSDEADDDAPTPIEVEISPEGNWGEDYSN